MKIHNKSIFDLVVANAAQATVVAYYSYNTGTESDTYIAEVENSAIKPGDAETIANLVEQFLDAATKKLGINRDNKTAVKCAIPGIDHPIYFVFYDTKYVICSTIARRDGTEYIIPAEPVKQAVADHGGHHGEGAE